MGSRFRSETQRRIAAVDIGVFGYRFLMPQLTLKKTVDGFLAAYEWRTFRFLLSDGRVVDVEAIWDDSNLRDAVRKAMEAERIEGVAIVSVTSWTPVKRVVKKK